MGASWLYNRERRAQRRPEGVFLFLTFTQRGLLWDGADTDQLSLMKG